VEQVVLESGAECGLVLRDAGTPAALAVGARKSILNDQVQEKILNIRIPDKDCTIKLPMARAEKRYFTLNTKAEKQGLVSEVAIESSCRIVTLRTIIQVHNQFSLPVDVYYMTDRGNEVECVGVVQPGEKLDLPLHAVYTPTNELFFSLPG
jgi:vacuolar protein sorting-associated protein 13A/C